jgi:SNF2 family DNA or RNA helicase
VVAHDGVSVVALAEYFVACQRVVPGITMEGGRARSWWWPLPAASDRDLIRSLVGSSSLDDHRAASQSLAEAVDHLVRQRLLNGATPNLVGQAILPPEENGPKASTEPTTKRKRSAKVAGRTVSQAWLEALGNAADPYLSWPKGASPNRELQALVDQVQSWVRNGAASQTRARVVLRLREPGTSAEADSLEQVTLAKGTEDDLWQIDVLVQDSEEPSIVVDAAMLWEAESPFAPTAISELLEGLGKAVRIAPELSGLLDSARASTVAVSSETALQFVQTRLVALTDADVGVRLPGWWSRRERLRLRAKVKTKKSRSAGSSSMRGGFGFDQLVAFEWEAALGGRKLSAAELRSLTDAAANKRSLVQVRGEWVELDPADLAAIAKLVGTKGEATASELLRAGLGLGLDGLAPPEIRAELDGLDVVADGWMGELLDGALHSSVAPIDDPVGFHGVLRPYQQRGAGWMVFLGQLGLGACLADDMGLGKTAQLIATMLADPLPDPTLVVCPVSVLGNWQRELERFAPSLRVKVHHGADRLRFEDVQLAAIPHGGSADVTDKHTDKNTDYVPGPPSEGPFGSALGDYRAEADVVLTTYSLVPRDLALLQSVRWGRMVLDEAQQVKNPGTAQTKAIRQLNVDRRVALTGTPVENRLAELWSLMHVLNPGLLGTAAEFKRNFALPIERDHDQAATDLLRRVTSPFVLRRLKTDKSIIDDLPDKIETTEHCPLTKEQASLYRAVVDDLLEKTESAEGIGRRGLVLAGITKLKQVCNHPAHFGRDGSALPGRSGKLDRVEELLDEIIEAGDKVLCFTQFAEWGELLVPHLAKRYGREPLWLHGGVRRGLRDGMVEQFQEPSGPPIFLLSLKAGGTGLNLTAASHVIHLDRWWNPAVENQATDRAFRIGQKRTVLVHKLVSTGTIEERIDEMINSKRALADAVVGTGEQWITELDTNELRNVISLRDQSYEG